VSVETAVPERMVCPQCRALFRGRFARCPRDGAALQAAVLDPLVGRTFAERYLIEDLLGEGAMGRVYRARHLRMSRRFAIKVLFGDQSANAKMVARFTHEAEAASRVQHRNVVGVVDFGETDEGILYLAMDYAAGPDLGLVIHRHGPMSSDRVLTITAQLCEGLAHAHGRGLIHRDFKPDNIILESGDEGEVARICDFGIAVLREGPATGEGERLTTDGLVVGTPHYMAPEQSVGDEVDPRTDLFALGVIIYEMLAGTLPFEGTPAQVARMHLNVDPPPVAVRVPGLAVDPLLEALAMRLMAKHPSDRPSSARAVADLVQLIRTDRAAASRVLAMAAGPGEILHTAPMANLAGARHGSERAQTIDETPRRRTDRPGERDGDYTEHTIAEPIRGGFELFPVRDSDTVLDDGPPLQGGRRRRGALVAIALLAGSGVLVGGLWLLGRDDAPVVASADADAGAVVDDRPIDGAVVITELPALPDAAVAATVEPVEPEPVLPPPAPVRPSDTGKRRPATTPKPTPSPKPTPPKPAPVETPTPAVATPAEPAPREPSALTGSLSQRYRTIGRKIDDLVHSHGESVAAPLKRRYLAIPIADAIRNPALGNEVSAQLTALNRDVERAAR
jgi:hypothetical protein